MQKHLNGLLKEVNEAFNDWMGLMQDPKCSLASFPYVSNIKRKGLIDKIGELNKHLTETPVEKL